MFLKVQENTDDIISVARNEITDDGVLPLFTALPLITSKRGFVLDLRRNRLSEDILMHLLNTSGENVAITKVNFSGNDISSPEIQQQLNGKSLISTRKSRRALAAQYLQDTITALMQNDLFSIERCILKNIDINVQTSFALFHSLANNVCCMELELTNNTLTSSAILRLFALLPKHPCLQILRLKDNPMSSAAWKALGKILPDLQSCFHELHISYSLANDPKCNEFTLGATSRWHRSLTQHPSPLRKLTLSNVNITDSTGSTLLTALSTWRSQLTYLDLSHNAMSDTIRFSIERFVAQSATHLQELNVAHNAFTLHGLKAIFMALGSTGHYSKLRTLQLGRQNTFDASLPELLEQAGKCHSLLRLHFVASVGHLKWKPHFDALEIKLTKNREQFTKEKRKVFPNRFSIRHRQRFLSLRMAKTMYLNTVHEVDFMLANQRKMQMGDQASNAMERTGGYRHVVFTVAVRFVETIVS